jgi:prophage maintenance system killer protein
VVTPASANISAGHGQSFQASALFTASDPFNDPMTQYDFWDTGGGGGHFALNGQALAVNQDNFVSAAQLTQVTYQSGAGTDTLWVRAGDGAQWSAWTSAFTVAAPIDTGPVVTLTSANISAMHGQSFQASSLFTASDPLNDPMTQYDFWDTGGGGGYFALNGTPLAANQDNYVSASQLAQVTYQSGAGTDTLWVRASDGAQWSAWTSSFTVTGPVDTGPVVTPASSTISATHGQSFQASSLFTVSDPFNDPMTQYDFWDTGAGGGYFALNGQALAAKQDNYVSASQLAQVTYQSGAGTDTLWVRASDGIQWSAWTSGLPVTGPVDTGPVVTPASSNISAMHGQSFQASSLFTASDPFNDPMTQYDFWDTGAGGGYFALNGQALAANQDDYVSAAQLAQVTYQSGSGADTLWVRASDGAQWSAWTTSFTVTAPIDTGPVVNSVTPNITTVAGQTFAASSLFTASDPFGDTIAQYDFWDIGADGGRFALNGQPLAVKQDDIVSASQLAQTTYVAGTGKDTLWVRVAEGGQWSAWSPSFTISDPSTIASGETLELPSAFSGSLAFTAQTGTLKLDDSTGFTGAVAGMAGSDTIDFSDIDFAAAQPPAFAGTSEGGVLTVTDGIHTANIALLGNYLASSFAARNDGHGGTSVMESSSNAADSSTQSGLLAQVVAQHGS